MMVEETVIDVSIHGCMPYVVLFRAIYSGSWLGETHNYFEEETHGPANGIERNPMIGRRFLRSPRA